MARVTGNVTGRGRGNHEFTVWYGRGHGTATFSEALDKVRDFIAEAKKNGMRQDGDILHFKTDRKNEKPEGV